MREGGKYRFFIPYKLGYGEGGAGASIPPFATLVFDVELLEVL
jgi:FKBP-type peptidyl-prolyl cis-trans isomerase FklB